MEAFVTLLIEQNAAISMKNQAFKDPTTYHSGPKDIIRNTLTL